MRRVGLLDPSVKMEMRERINCSGSRRMIRRQESDVLVHFSKLTFLYCFRTGKDVENRTKIVQSTKFTCEQRAGI